MSEYVFEKRTILFEAEDRLRNSGKWEMIERFLSVLVGYLKLEAERASASGTSIFMQNSLGHLNNNKCVRFRLRLPFGSSIFYFKQVVRKIG